MPDLAALLREQRKSRGLSQQRLASLCGCSRQYVAQLEASQRVKPSQRLTLALANALALTGERRRTLFVAAGQPALDRPAREPKDVASLARMSLQATRLPAFLHNSLWQLQGFNPQAEQMFRAVGAVLAQGESLLRTVFALKRRYFYDWEGSARTLLAEFKRDLAAGDLAGYDELIADLRKRPDFSRLWRTTEPIPDAEPVSSMAIRLPGTDRLELCFLNAKFVNLIDLWCITVVPTNAAAKAVFARFSS